MSEAGARPLRRERLRSSPYVSMAPVQLPPGQGYVFRGPAPAGYL
jgi:hypothetical protein